MNTATSPAGGQKITPHLWFDKEAKEATAFYIAAFANSKITHTTTLRNTPSGDCDIVSFELAGQQFMAISAGPYFTFTPAVSLFVACDTKEEVDALWKTLLDGGEALMELGAYPFSEKYGWLKDKYGLSWQVMYMGGREVKQKIMPTIMFVGDVCGKAEEAMNFYTSVFSNSPNPTPFDAAQGKSEVNFILRYEKGEEPDKEGTIKHGGFMLAGQQFAAMDSAYKHEFAFSEAISFIVHCDTQEEIDYFWEKFSADPKAEQCGWLKDAYGLSWQIVPSVMDEMMKDADEKRLARVTEAFLQMKKFDIAALKKAYEE